MNECDLCGQNDAECHCYLHELEERIGRLEEGLDQLTNIVNAIHEYLMKKEDENANTY